MAGDDRYRSDETTRDYLTNHAALPDGVRVMVVAGPDAGAELVIPPSGCVIGKSRSCDLVLRDGFVSQRHLRIDPHDRYLEVRDLDSKNGSFFHGGRFELIRVGVDAAIALGETVLCIAGPPRPQSAVDRFGDLVAASAEMKQVIDRLRRFAAGNIAVLIHGETGTGKELAARALHHESPRRDGPWVVCDLAAMPASLIESELFGHVRGAFTGASGDRAGAFEHAHGGTIFLDEIGELDLALQPRLLRVLEAHEVKRVGDAAYRPVDVRVVAATNRDLQREVADGGFRSDLYHRLAGVAVRLPPLRERCDDIPALADHILSEMAETAGRPPPRIAGAVLDALDAYHWPGNVRELRNVLERAYSLSGDPAVVDIAALELDETSPTPTPPPRHPPGVEIDLATPFKEAKQRLIDRWERSYLQALLDRCEGNVALAARRAGIDRVHLHRLVKKHGGLS